MFVGDFYMIPAGTMHIFRTTSVVHTSFGWNSVLGAAPAAAGAAATPPSISPRGAGAPAAAGVFTRKRVRDDGAAEYPVDDSVDGKAPRNFDPLILV